MRIVLQRVSECSVVVDNITFSEIQKGILVLVGFTQGDNNTTTDLILDKIINLRIFEDSDGKLNLSLKDIDGELMIVPNFTIYGDARKGRRPSFVASLKPDDAKVLFDQMVIKTKEVFEKSAFGIFQADMKVHLVNDGPVTILLDSDKLF